MQATVHINGVLVQGYSRAKDSNLIQEHRAKSVVHELKPSCGVWEYCTHCLIDAAGLLKGNRRIMGHEMRHGWHNI